MLSGLKFIPRDQIDKTLDEKATDSDSRKSYKKKKKSHHGGSSDDGSQRIKKRSRKKWYSSEEDSSLYSGASESGSDQGKSKKVKSKKGKSKKSGRREYSSDDDYAKEDKVVQKGHKKGKGRLNKDSDDDMDGNCGVSRSTEKENIVRKEMGLEWMLRPKDNVDQKSASTIDMVEEAPAKEIKKANPRELNPYFNNDGSGYPEEADGASSRGSNLLSNSVVGDGGASWRLKALKRAQEQAAREGKKLDEVVGERWGSLGKLAVSVASASAAPSHAHLHAIKNRIRLQTKEQKTVPGDQSKVIIEGKIPVQTTDLGRRVTRIKSQQNKPLVLSSISEALKSEIRQKLEEDAERDNQKDMPSQHAKNKMRVPRPDDSLSWGKRKSQSMSVKDASVISSALASLQKFNNDGSFLKEFKSQQDDDSYSERDRKVVSDVSKSEKSSREDVGHVKPALSANQLAAKVMQLRMKGKHDEAEKLLKDAEGDEGKSKGVTITTNPQGDETTSRYIMHGIKTREKMKEEDADMHVARLIMQNKKYSVSGQADDEYDYDEGPRRKKRGKGDEVPKSMGNTRFEKHILTQQERCNFCFENPKRPRHLVIAIANFTYLMLPQWKPVVPGHCCILPMQHELATRSVDDNVWDELRNFKKCLLMMFAKQDMDVVFLETVMGLAKQTRHCMVECIPLPPDIAKQAPLYFKKAIDEAEEEWSQHNAKKLIDTSEKGLRNSIPKDFPYFHVEFGLKKGYVHVIDDESQFKSSFGVNVIRGMLRLPAEDMHRRQRHESIDTQKEAVANFGRNWEPFDWTKQLD